MLRLKFIAGLFEQPYADVKHAEAITDNAEARALALEAARKSVVLLKNDGVLPLRADRLKTLAVIGPNAARIDLGGYSNVPTHAVTVLDGIRAKLGDRVQRRERRRRAADRQRRLVRGRSRARPTRSATASASRKPCRSRKAPTRSCS